MFKPADHTGVRRYIDQVTQELAQAGIPVAGVEVDPPEQVASCGREWAQISLAGDWARFHLVWADHSGWLVGTHADHYPVRPHGQIHPAPAQVARQARTHMHALAHGGWVKALDRP